MSARSFVDTNVLVYTDDRDDQRKSDCAHRVLEGLLRNRVGVLSTQVLQEYFVTATRKLDVPAEVARRKVELFARLEVKINRPNDVLAAIDLSGHDQLSFWDALVVNAALTSGCRVLYTEDLQAGRRFGDLEIVNPFAS